MFGTLKPGFRCLASLKLVVNVVGLCNQGIATGWTGVDVSTPLLPGVVPEIDANPVSFYWGRWKEVGNMELDSPVASVR